MDGGRVGHPDDELVEVGARVDAGRADGGERRLQLRGASGTERGHVPQPMRPERRQPHGRGQGEEGLVRADVAGRTLTPDVLLASAKRHHERPLPVEVVRQAHEPAGDLPDERIGAREDAEVRPAVLERDAQRLALAGRDIRAVRPWRGQDREGHRLDHAHEERACGVGDARDLRHGLQQPEEVRLAHDDPGHRPVGIREKPLERLEIGGAGGVAIRYQRQLVGLESATPEIRGEGLAIVRMDGRRHEHAFTAGRPAGHQGGFGGGRAAVVVRGRHDIEPGELGEERLILVDALERALADLRLIRRVGRVPLAAEQHLVDDRRAEVAIRAGTQERREVHPVARRERLHTLAQRELGLGLGKVQR